MKTINRLVILFFSFLFYFNSPIYAQKKILLDKDTMIAITPRELGTVNKIIESYEWSKKEIILKDSLIKLDSANIAIQDSLILELKLREKKKEDFYINQSILFKQEQERLKKELKKKTIFGIGTGTIIGALVGILIGVLVK
jgi:hypothetical protein